MGVNVRLAVRMGALLLFVAAMAAFAPPANAAKRRVVVVNAAADQQAGSAAASELRKALTASEKLTPVPTGELARALETPLSETNAADARFEQATKIFESAREALARFAYDDALSQLEQAEQTLLRTAPEPRVVALLARVNFEAARTYISQGNRERAVAAFRAVRNLEPQRTALDPALYLDEVVSAYDEAGKPLEASAEIVFSTTYDTATLFVDGRPLEAGARSAKVTPGIHYVSATLADYRPNGRRVVLAQGENLAVKLRQVPEDVDERARALRHALLSGPRNESAFLDAGRSAVALARVDAAILLREAAGMRQVVAAVYDARTDEIGKWLPVDSAGMSAILEPLLPRARDTRPPDIVFPPPKPKPTPWYEKRWGQAVILGSSGVALTLLGLIATSMNDDNGTPRVDGNLCSFERCQ